MRKTNESFFADKKLRFLTSMILLCSVGILMLPLCFTQISAIVDVTIQR